MSEPTVHALFRPHFESWGTTRLCCGRPVLDREGRTRPAVSITVENNVRRVTCGNCKHTKLYRQVVRGLPQPEQHGENRPEN